MNNLIPFEFDQQSIRVIRDEDGNAVFVARDVATALGYADPGRAVRQHCKGAGESTAPSAGGIQTFRTIREPDVYRLIVRSKLPSAERFESWVFEEVLPTIRKHGRYEAPSSPVPAESDRVTAISRASAIAGALDAAARAFGFDDNMRMISVNQAVQRRTGVDLLAELGATHLLSPVNERYMTVTELGTPFGMSGKAVNLLLSDLGYQWRDRDGKGKTIWRLTDTGRKAGGRMLDTGKRHGDGTPVQQLKWPESVAEVLREEAA